MIKFPNKTDFFEEKKAGDGEKIEKLTERFEIRITKTEKEILKQLKADGINISNEIRKMVLKLNEGLVHSQIIEKYTKIKYKLDNSIIQLEELKKKYMVIKDLRGDTEEEIQDLVNKRSKIRYEIDNLTQEVSHFQKYLSKYADFFEK